MGKSQSGTGSTANAGVVGAASTAAPSKPSPKSAKRPTSKGHGLSDSDLLNILMVDLNRVQERFGEVHFFRIPGADEPSGIMLPKGLDICETCGLIIIRGDQPYCEAHAKSKPEVVPG